MGIKPIFYFVQPNGDDRHVGVRILLSDLPTAVVTVESNSTDHEVVEEHLPVEFVHEGTDDEFFVERTLDSERLDSWSEDPSVRAIAVTGLGGIGKTALTSAWLKRRASPTRSFQGIFFFSFYSDPQPDGFFERLLEFANRHFGFVGNPDLETSENAAEIVKSLNLLVVLDGLEVVQEVEEPRDSDPITHQSLRQFTVSVLSSPGSLLVFTSRFPLVDFDRELGRRARWLSLDRLSRAAGVQLLRSLGVEGALAALETSVDALEGHLSPFAFLRTRRISGSVSAALGAAEPDGTGLETKLIRLVEFYLSVITEDQRMILMNLGLFRSVVDIVQSKACRAGML